MLRVQGRALVDDFGLDENSRLVVSAAALDAIRQFQCGDCKIYPGARAPTPEEEEAEMWEEARRVADAIRKARRRR
jgi:hypothetical protein